VNNATTVALTIAVNGTVVGSVAAGEIQNPIPTALPARPWTVEARSPSGRVLATLTVGPDDRISDQAGVFNLEFLACGQIGLWAGEPIGDEPFPVGATPMPCD
jgi:hypothetical protein